MVFKDVTLIALYISKGWKMTTRFVCCCMLMISDSMSKYIANKYPKIAIEGIFEMKDLRIAKKILGVEIIKDRKKGILYLTQ